MLLKKLFELAWNLFKFVFPRIPFNRLSIREYLMKKKDPEKCQNVKELLVKKKSSNHETDRIEEVWGVSNGDGRSKRVIEKKYREVSV